MKVLTWVFASIVLLIGLVIFAYFYFFVGITPKARYKKCAEFCEETMFNESNIPLCKLECEEETGYSPSGGSTTKQSAETSPKTTTKSNSNSDPEDINYYCEWSWPQKIIDADTKEVIKRCTSTKPYCYYADRTYKTVGCCSDAEHTDCTLLSDMD